LKESSTGIPNDEWSVTDRPSCYHTCGLNGKEFSAVSGRLYLTIRAIAKAVPTPATASSRTYRWATTGDINAFFGLMLDNIADLLLTVGLLTAAFEFPTNFALRYMVPGTAIGVLVGDLLFFWMALSLARRTNHRDVTAMPLGLDTPSTFGMVFFVLGPAFVTAKETMSVEDAARWTWHIGICSIVISGLFKLVCACGSNWIRRKLPRAGLLGSLAAIALVLISFLPLLEILHFPVVGFLALVIVLTTLVARVSLPLRIPGALAALLIGGGVYYAMQAAGALPAAPEPAIHATEALLPYEWISVFTFEWLRALPATIHYLPVVIPFALATVIGGIDCTESASAAGDEFDTGRVIGVEALATLIAGLCGGVIQTTPYIGHPAYKAMGGRAAYTLATALFVGGAGLIGYFGFLYLIIPKAAVFPILVFIGLEITAQSFRATPPRHYPAVALACVPALAALALIFADKILGDGVMRANHIDVMSLHDAGLRQELETIRVLANGFIVTSLLWASGLAAIIDRRLRPAAAFFGVAAVFTLFGVIHSPFANSQVFFPWQLTPEMRTVTIHYAVGYAAVVVLLLLLDAWRKWAADDDDDSSTGDSHVFSS
jgi:AGZA family xanthine/uracil permease-like MFS transporter